MFCLFISSIDYKVIPREIKPIATYIRSRHDDGWTGGEETEERRAHLDNRNTLFGPEC